MPQGPFQPIHPNPYIVGNPIRSREMFFGRVDEFRFIARALENGQKTALIVLFGERRSGKSSILYQILNGELGEAFLPIFVDMQIMAGIANEAEFFSRIIADTCKAQGKNAPSSGQYALRSDESNPPEVFRQFLNDLKEQFPQRSILFLIDEYEILEAKINEGCLPRNVLTFFAGLLESEQVSFVFTGSKKLELRDEKLWGGELLQKAVSRKISFLTKDDTARLITQPLVNQVGFAPEVIAQIYSLTAGQPFYTQLICQNLVYHLNEVRKNHVDSADVQVVVENILENPPPQMIFNWSEHSAERKLVLSLLGEFAETSGAFLSAYDIRRGISKNKLEVVIGHAQLNSVLAELFQDEYVLQKDHKYSFRLDLFRRWIRHDHNIWQVKKEIGGEELARITKAAQETATKRKRAMTVLERCLLGVAVLVVAYLAMKLFWETKRRVVMQANGGPFHVAVVDENNIAIAPEDSGGKVLNLTKGEKYVFTATLLANNETQSKTVTIARDTTINFIFTEYPVTVVTDAAGVVATLGDTTIRTEGLPEPWKCTFFAAAGAYSLKVWDSENESNVIDTTITVLSQKDTIAIDFPDIVVITVQANLPFDYRYESGRKNGNGKSQLESKNFYSEVIRGCGKGKYQFTFASVRTGQKITVDKYVTTNETIAVKLDPNWKDKSQPKPDRPPPSATFRLTIITEPGNARVFLNGTPMGYTPFETSLAVGRYSITLEKEGYDDYPFEYEHNSEAKPLPVIKLTPQYGDIEVRVNDEQNVAPSNIKVYAVSTDGERILLGETPKSIKKTLRVGTYSIQVEPSRYKIISENTTVVIQKGENPPVKLRVKKER
jgi:hypothetical protein